MTLFKRFLCAFALLALLNPANAAFGDISFGGIINCNNPERTGTLDFINGAPNGDYSALIQASLDAFDATPSVDGTDLTSDGISKDFNIPGDESKGLKFTVGYGVAALKALAPFEETEVPFSITPGDDLTSQTGFGSASGTLVINDTGCSDDDTNSGDEDEEELGDLLSGATADSFETIDVSNTNGTDLTVNITYKIPTTLYNTFVGNLKEGENITDKAKELAKKFSVKLDFARLKKEAFKELKAAAKGKKGKEKKEAIEAAKKTGFNKLLSEIRMKLPKVKDAKDKDAVKKIRKAKKKKILEGLEVTVKSTTENTETGETCLAFVVTLPAKVCPKTGGDKTLVIGGLRINVPRLDAGESLTVDVPVRVLGIFQEFFGSTETESKGKKRKSSLGSTTIPLTITNPASE